MTCGLILVVSAAAFENLAVATTLPITVRELGGLASIISSALLWPALRYLAHVGTTAPAWRRLVDALQLTVSVGLLLSSAWTTALWVARRLPGRLAPDAA